MVHLEQRIEEQVREAFSGVVGSDGDRMVGAIQSLDEEDARKAVGLALYVCGHIVNDIYPDGATEAELQELAQAIVTEESDWVDVGDAATIAKFLGEVAKGQDPSISQSELAGTAFVCGGHLLASFSNEDQKWWEYLNEIEDTIEAR